MNEEAASFCAEVLELLHGEELLVVEVFHVVHDTISSTLLNLSQRL